MIYKKIAIIHKPNLDDITQRVVEKIVAFAENNKVDIVSKYFNGDESTLVISVGGDGTMLGAIRAATKIKNSVILGINTGTLGFLTEEIPNNLNKFLEDVFYSENKSFIEERMVLESHLSFIKGTYIAANEFVVSSHVNIPLKTKVFINDNFVNEHSGSGVLVSSATGSTALSLSAGGAIISPNTNVMQIVPLLPHTLSSRPIITTGKDTIKIVTELSARIPEINIHADGKEIAFCNKKYYDRKIYIIIKKHDKHVKIWRPKDWNFFEILSKKMR